MGGCQQGGLGKGFLGPSGPSLGPSWTSAAQLAADITNCVMSAASCTANFQGIADEGSKANLRKRVLDGTLRSAGWLSLDICAKSAGSGRLPGEIPRFGRAGWQGLAIQAARLKQTLLAQRPPNSQGTTYVSPSALGRRRTSSTHKDTSKLSCSECPCSRVCVVLNRWSPISCCPMCCLPTGCTLEGRPFGVSPSARSGGNFECRCLPILCSAACGQVYVCLAESSGGVGGEGFDVHNSCLVSNFMALLVA